MPPSNFFDHEFLITVSDIWKFNDLLVLKIM